MTEGGATLLSFLIRHGRHLCSQSHALQPPLQPQQQQPPPPLPLPSPAPPLFPSQDHYPLLPLSLAPPALPLLPPPPLQQQQQQHQQPRLPLSATYPAALQRLAGALQACEALLSQ